MSDSNDLDRIKQFMDADGRLIGWPRKLAFKRIAAGCLAAKFTPGRDYTEREVNALLEDWHTFNDPVTLRRFLIDLGYLDRTTDGARYWLVSLTGTGDIVCES
jgi:hypothetical protein